MKKATIDMSKIEVDKRYEGKVKARCPKCNGNLEILVTKEAEPSMWFPDCYHHYYYIHCKSCKLMSSPYFPDNPNIGLTEEEVEDLKKGMIECEEIQK